MTDSQYKITLVNGVLYSLYVTGIWHMDSQIANCNAVRLRLMSQQHVYIIIL